MDVEESAIEEDPKVYETVEEAIEYVNKLGDEGDEIEGANFVYGPVTLSENPDTPSNNLAISRDIEGEAI